MTVNCALCGLPATPPLRDGARTYCCAGCREVSRLLGDPAAVPAEPPPALSAAVPGGRSAFLWIEGMHCASCERLVAIAAPGVPGVLAAQASYATGAARIDYDPARIAPTELPAALQRATGYRARLRGVDAPEYDERPELLRMLSGGCLASALMMLSFLFVYPIHAGFTEPKDYEAIRWLAFGLTPFALFVLCTVLVFYVGWPILRGAWVGLRVGILNIDSLLALAVLSAYGYSLIQLLRDPIDLYFDVAGSIVAVVTIGRFLERGAREKALHELGRIMNARPPAARVVRAGRCFTCALDEIAPGDRVFVRSGEAIPVDGTIVDGAGAVDESLLTGEPFPAARGTGDRALGGAVLREGALEIDVGPAVECRIESLAGVLWNAQCAARGLQGRIARFAQWFVPAVLALAALVGIAMLLGGASPERALLASLATLTVSCPCTFGLAIPLTTALASAAGLRRGILVTRQDLFETAERPARIAIDKTGTLSSGEMAVLEVIGPPEIATLAAAVERDSAHPVARAIAALSGSRGARGFESHPGRGAIARVGSRRVAVGSAALFHELGWTIPPALAEQAEARAHDDGVVSYVGWDGSAAGAILTVDRPRPGWEQLVGSLRQRARVVLVTGAQRAGGYGARVDEVLAGVPPEAKAAVVRQLRRDGPVAMIGDGSNDAPALAQADLGIAFGAPTALAAQAADIVVLGDRLDRIADALALVDAAQRRVRQNLAWALGYNAIAIPLAMAGLLNPLVAALAMVASSLLVVANAMRPFLRDHEGAGPVSNERPPRAAMTGG